MRNQHLIDILCLCDKVSLEAAVAYLAVTMNLFGDALYQKRGGKGQVKDNPHTCCWNLHNNTKELFMQALGFIVPGTYHIW